MGERNTSNENREREREEECVKKKENQGIDIKVVKHRKEDKYWIQRDMLENSKKDNE